MANGDDDNGDKKKPPRRILARVFDKLTHKPPPPKWAAPSFIRTEWVPSGPAPGGGSPPRPTEQRGPHQTPATSPASTKPAPAKDPARAKLEEQAEARREELRKIERDCREGQRRAHAEADALLTEKLGDKTGIARLAAGGTAEPRQAEGHASEVAMLDEYFDHRWASLNDAIATAFEVGHFTDDQAAAESRAASRAADRGDDDGGRGLGD